MKTIYCLLFTCLTITGSCKDPQPKYSVPATPWAESLGNHRAVLEIKEAAPVTVLDINWRRHDPNPGEKCFLIIEAATGDTVQNIYRYSVTNERCRIAFGPVRNRGIYHFYYLPFEVQEGSGFYGKDYLKREKAPSGKWVNDTRIGDVMKYKSLPVASLAGFQSRTAFDSFYPMEVIPLASEKQALLKTFKADYLLFPEGRENPIRMKDEIPLRWIEKGPSEKFIAEALKNEYYAFQIGVYSPLMDLNDVKVEFSPLEGKKSVIPVSAMTCFNTGGTGPYGQHFEKKVNIGKGSVQPLWIGIDIPADIPGGLYTGTIVVKPGNSESRKIELSLKVSEKVLSDRGDSEPWRHSRLRWLNSTLGIDDKPTKPFDAIEFLGDDAYRLTDKVLKMDPSGFPGSIKVGNTEILSGPLSFVVETSTGTEQFSLPQEISLLKNEPGLISGSWKSISKNIEIAGIGVVESDGYINYKLKLRALNGISLNDIRLEIPLVNDIAQYMIGMGLPGTEVPESHSAGWKGPHDSFWIGNADAGLWCELRGGTYHGPLLGLYYPDPPGSWFNSGKGGFRIRKDAKGTTAVVNSGSREMKSGESMDFEWSFLITPSKKINYHSQFTDKYYHKGRPPIPSNDDLKYGIKIVNLHHANNYNPHINYPFIAVDSLKWIVNQMHSKGLKVKIYYTIRELTNYATEIWALRSLGDEILAYGKRGGYPWLREHLVVDYQAQWYHHFPDISPDAAVLSPFGESRWYNYYIEGLAWLVRNVDIDGLYLDDVTYDRRTLKRIRKVLDNEKPGCILDLHSNTGFTIGPANQYTEYFPYIDKLWFGESFQYDKMPPANWFVEVSGIPFGLMGDMLQGGGNRWRGMVYGMTVRYPWVTEGIDSDPRPVWEIWDKFGIETSAMKGYWENDCPVRTSNTDIKATVYQKEGESLISVASWSDKPTEFSLRFDWEALGIDPQKATLVAPYIKDFQEEKTFGPGDFITVDPAKGWLLYLREK